METSQVACRTRSRMSVLLPTGCDAPTHSMGSLAWKQNSHPLENISRMDSIHWFFLTYLLKAIDISSCDMNFCKMVGLVGWKMPWLTRTRFLFRHSSYPFWSRVNRTQHKSVFRSFHLHHFVRFVLWVLVIHHMSMNGSQGTGSRSLHIRSIQLLCPLSHIFRDSWYYCLPWHVMHANGY